MNLCFLVQLQATPHGCTLNYVWRGPRRFILFLFRTMTVQWPCSKPLMLLRCTSKRVSPKPREDWQVSNGSLDQASNMPVSSLVKRLTAQLRRMTCYASATSPRKWRVWRWLFPMHCLGVRINNPPSSALLAFRSIERWDETSFDVLSVVMHVRWASRAWEQALQNPCSCRGCWLLLQENLQLMVPIQWLATCFATAHAADFSGMRLLIRACCWWPSRWLKTMGNGALTKLTINGPRLEYSTSELTAHT